jgi:hypothetical protein
LEKDGPKEGAESPRFGLTHINAGNRIESPMRSLAQATRIVNDGVAPPRKEDAAAARSKTPLLVYQQKIESPYRRKYNYAKRESHLYLGRETGLNVDLPLSGTKPAPRAKHSQAVHNSISFIDSKQLVFANEEKKSIMDSTFD